MLKMLWDIIKAHPEVGNLRRKLSVAEQRIVELEAEVAFLKDELRDAAVRESQSEKKIAGLEKAIEDLRNFKYRLKEVQGEILKVIANAEGRPIDRSTIRRMLVLPVQTAEYHLHRLKEIGYITTLANQAVEKFQLTQAGREYLVENDLLR